MNVYNHDEDFDLELFRIKKKDKVYNDKEGWRLEAFSTKGIRYWRFAHGSRKDRITKYVGNDERVRRLCASQLSRRKPRSVFI